MKKFLLAFLQISMLAAALPALADEAAFDPGIILSDRDLTTADVPPGFSQAFLESRGGAIAKMTFLDLDGTMKKPGDLIDFYGKSFGVNPRFLLALIQKEQSLVHAKNPSKCQIDWATGYGRPDGSTCDDPAWQRFRGFTSQIVNAAAFVQCFYEDVTDRCGRSRTFGYFPGRTAQIDGQAVTPGNLATALLYTYTPHIHGNRNLVKLWTGWFSMSYPDGSLLRSPDGSTYLIQGGLKRRFANNGALRTRADATKAIPVTSAVLAGYEDGADIQFPEYALVRAPSGSVYLLVGDRKRPVESMETFRAIGFNPEEIDDVTDEDLAPYAEGEAITLKSAYPTGALLQDSRTGGVYFVEDGVKRPIVSAEIMKANWPEKKISSVSAAALEKYATGEPVRFRDGELISGPATGPAVFVISNGMRRPIVSGAAFEQLGYSWKRVIRTNDAAVNLHPLGDPVTGAPAAEGTQTAAR